MLPEVKSHSKLDFDAQIRIYAKNDAEPSRNYISILVLMVKSYDEKRFSVFLPMYTSLNMKKASINFILIITFGSLKAKFEQI